MSPTKRVAALKSELAAARAERDAWRAVAEQLARQSAPVTLPYYVPITTPGTAIPSLYEITCCGDA